MQQYLLLKNKKNVPDSILLSLAKSDKYRADLYEAMKKINLIEKFPTAYRNQQEIAKSILVKDNGYYEIRFGSICFHYNRRLR